MSRKIVSIYRSDERIPFAIIKCNEVYETPNGEYLITVIIDDRYGEENRQLSTFEYDYYHVVECTAEVVERIEALRDVLLSKEP